MAEHGFTLIVEGDVESRLDDLHEAGCDDATCRTTSGGAVWYAGFEREAPTREEALRSAMADVESVGGLRMPHPRAASVGSWAPVSSTPYPVAALFGSHHDARTIPMFR